MSLDLKSLKFGNNKELEDVINEQGLENVEVDFLMLILAFENDLISNLI